MQRSFVSDGQPANFRGLRGAFDTVRSVVLTRFPDLVRRSFPTCPAGEEAFAYALELYLHAIPNLDTALDGWRMLRLVHESATSLQAVGIMHVLPTGELPLEVELCREPALTLYPELQEFDQRFELTAVA
jgi:hypothetical protein